MVDMQQIARDLAGMVSESEQSDAILNALRQCEADTIRRCAAIVEHEMNFDDVRTDTRVMAAVSRVEIAILSLLPKELGQ